MSRARPVSLDYHLIADGDVLDREPPVAQDSGPDIPVAPVASLASADALFDEAVDMAVLDQEVADSLLNIVPVAEDGEFLDAASVATAGGSAGPDGWDLESELSGLSLQATGLPEWHVLMTDGTILTADNTPRIGSGDYGAFGSSLDFGPSAGSGHQSSSAGDLIFLDFESYARPSSPGGGGGKDKKNKGSDESSSTGDPGDPVVMSEYVSGPDGGYNIEIDFKGTWTAALQSAFIDSSEWISSFIVGDISDVRYRGWIDDLRITAELVEIDGTGNILGQAGPTAIRTADYLPATGVMEFDVADAEDFLLDGTWGDIVFHEMLHTVGFGAIWDLKGLVADSGTNDPTFTGEQAMLAYDQLFDGSGGVPLEWGYGSGTDESHWRESTFDNEIMTGFINESNYLSDMTTASLEDLGYDTTWAA